MPTLQLRRDRTLDVPEYGKWIDQHQLQDLVRRSGSHFFDDDTIRYFRSRLHDVRPGPDGWYFITSEKHVAWTSYGSINEPRKYTLRRLSVNDDNTDLCIDEYEEFQYFATLQRARTALKYAVERGTKPCSVCKYRLVINDADAYQCAECAARARRQTAKAGV